MIGSIEVDKQIHIASVVESIGENRPEDGQSLDLMLAAKINDSLQIQFDKFHT